MFENAGRRRLAPERDRAAPLPERGPKSQVVISKIENSQSNLDLQARRLRRLFFFAADTARTIATLAYGVSR